LYEEEEKITHDPKDGEEEEEMEYDSSNDEDEVESDIDTNMNDDDNIVELEDAELICNEPD